MRAGRACVRKLYLPPLSGWSASDPGIRSGLVRVSYARELGGEPEVGLHTLDLMQMTHTGLDA